MKKKKNKIVKKPKDKQNIYFWSKLNPNKKLEGYYIKSEDLFFIGYEMSGDFIFRQFIKKWKPKK